MSDDFDRLRRTMGELAEHGGGSDLYERTLSTSRRLTRRRNALAGGAVAVAVLGLGVPVALAGGNRTAPPPTALASPSPSLPPAPSPSASSSPTSPAPSSPSSPTSSSPVPDRTSAKPPPPTGCPVGAATLLRVTDLPADWTLEDITCLKGWAEARPKAPTEAEQGDGVVLYRYQNGKWKEVVQGSAIECATHGVPEAIGRRLSSCYYD